MQHRVFPPIPARQKIKLMTNNFYLTRHFLQQNPKNPRAPATEINLHTCIHLKWFHRSRHLEQTKFCPISQMQSPAHPISRNPQKSDFSYWSSFASRLFPAQKCKKLKQSLSQPPTKNVFSKNSKTVMYNYFYNIN